jgi:pyroglutamyl-peptidase
MTRVLITAFEPYDRWQANASWLALVELTKNLPELPEVVTRLYPVDYDEVRRRLESDLAGGYDVALHVGQAPGSAAVQLEAVGINVAQGGTADGEARPLVEGGPVAYRSNLPLSDWAAMLRSAGIPSQVSYHAGTYLCNAALYLSHHLAQQTGQATRSAFLHLPLAPAQVVLDRSPAPSMPSELCAAAIRLILAELRSRD